MCANKESEVANLKHIQNILEERIMWFKKRQLETKRAIKARHRLETLPHPTVTHTMLEAELCYNLNQIGLDALITIIEKVDDQNSSFSKTQLSEEFLRQIVEKEELFVKKQLSETQYLELFQVVFSLDEDYQRRAIAGFILDFADQLIREIFRNIAIFDDSYTNEVIASLIKHLKKTFED